MSILVKLVSDESGKEGNHAWVVEGEIDGPDDGRSLWDEEPVDGRLLDLRLNTVDEVLLRLISKQFLVK